MFWPSSYLRRCEVRAFPVLTAESSRIKIWLGRDFGPFWEEMSQVEVSLQSPNVQSSSLFGAGYVPSRLVIVTGFSDTF